MDEHERHMIGMLARVLHRAQSSADAQLRQEALSFSAGGVSGLLAREWDRWAARFNHPLEISEEQRQIVLLALHKLKLERPGWEFAIGEIEAKLGGQLDWPPAKEK